MAQPGGVFREPMRPSSSRSESENKVGPDEGPDRREEKIFQMIFWFDIAYVDFKVARKRTVAISLFQLWPKRPLLSGAISAAAAPVGWH